MRGYFLFEPPGFRTHEKELMLPASCTESCGNKVQIDWLSRFLWPSNSLFHPVNWMKMAFGMRSAGKCSSLQMQHLLSDCLPIWFQQIFQVSAFSRQGFLVRNRICQGTRARGRWKEHGHSPSKELVWTSVSCVCSGGGAETSSASSIALVIQFCVCFGWGDILCGAFVSRIYQN